MRTAYKKKIDDVAIEGAHGGSGRRRLLLSAADDISPNLEAVTKGYLDPGGSFDWHQHDEHDEFFFVLEGTGKISYVDGREFNYEAGDLIYSPAEISHRLDNTGDEVNVFFFIRISS